MRDLRKSVAKEIRTLSESEIQEKLYGEYLGRLKKGLSIPTLPEPTPHHLQADPDWTGKEILVGELEHLREELIALKEERERLAGELSRYTVGIAAPIGLSSSEALVGISSPPGYLSARWLGKFFGIGLLVAAIGYSIGSQFLQASPPIGSEVSPYTIQVAVYDVKSPAERALQLLQELGYSAFLAEFPHRDGRLQYRIYVGRFVTKIEAEIEKARLNSDSRFSDAFVRLK